MIQYLKGSQKWMTRKEERKEGGISRKGEREDIKEGAMEGRKKGRKEGRNAQRPRQEGIFPEGTFDVVQHDVVAPIFGVEAAKPA